VHVGWHLPLKKVTRGEQTNEEKTIGLLHLLMAAPFWKNVNWNYKEKSRTQIHFLII